MSDWLFSDILGGSLGGLADGLFGASFRGVEFAMADTDSEVGRRVVQFLFPGRDEKVFEDLGALDGEISVVGIIVGDDYIRRAKALHRACREPGPGTLSHPWLGEIEVVLLRPARISWSDRELRVARFDAVFVRASEPQAVDAGTLGGLLDAADELVADMRDMLRGALSPLLLPLQLFAGASSWASGLATTWSRLAAGGRGAGAIAGRLAAPLAELGRIGSQPAGAAFPDAMASSIAATPQAVVSAAGPVRAPAIGPASGSIAGDAAVIAPGPAAGLLLQFAAAAEDGYAEPEPAPVLSLAAQAAALSAAVAVGAEIDHDSREAALAWRAEIDGALAAAAGRAAALASGPGLAGINATAGVGATWRGLIDLRAAVAADINERVGRLPSVTTLRLPADTNVWLAALHVAGDAPLLPGLLDLNRRNRIRAAGLLPAGRVLEALTR